jgi:hypothetical protein
MRMRMFHRKKVWMKSMPLFQTSDIFECGLNGK